MRTAARLFSLSFEKRSICRRLIVYSGFFLVLCCLSASQVLPQDCTVCAGPITDNYITAEGYTFHPDHFVCAACDEVIKGEYHFDKDLFYHPVCYRQSAGYTCAYCGEVLSDSWIEANHRRYHLSCYRDHVQPRCAICLNLLDTDYLQDTWGNTFHPEHNSEYDTCFSCSRLVTSALTGGGIRLPDGRAVCHLCLKRSVTSTETAAGIAREVEAILSEAGFVHPWPDYQISLVDRITIREQAGDSYHPDMEGFTHVSERRFGNQILTRGIQVYILSHLQETHFEGVLAHELLHIWESVNEVTGLPRDLSEGFCNLGSMLVYSSVDDAHARHRLQNLEKSEDPAYGLGYRRMKRIYRTMGLLRLLEKLGSARQWEDLEQ